MLQKERDQALATALQQLEKQYGKGAVLRMGSGSVQQVAVIPSGCLSLDAAVGVGGFPRGRVIEVFGPESSGKTTIALQVVAQAQKRGGTAAFIDAEHALDPTYARNLGVNMDDLLISQPDYGEQALEITSTLAGSFAVDIVVVDSVAALVPKAELEGEMGDSFMGLHARLMSQAMRKLTGNVSRTQTCLIFINQIREKIGVVFGNPETTTGGRALKFFSSLRLDVRRIGAIKEGEKIIGSRTKIKVVKNKMAPPFREVEVDLIHGEGVSLEAELLDRGVEQKIVDKSGAWYAYDGERLGQGREASRQFLKENAAMRDRLETQIRQALGIAVDPSPSALPLKPAASAEPISTSRRSQTA
ncbi:MAG: recombinase RecA [Acidobacteriia bacterium]|nr:recombinase RecA [Terriglobia bacterium]